MPKKTSLLKQSCLLTQKWICPIHAEPVQFVSQRSQSLMASMPGISLFLVELLRPVTLKTRFIGKNLQGTASEFPAAAPKVHDVGSAAGLSYRCCTHQRAGLAGIIESLRIAPQAGQQRRLQDLIEALEGQRSIVPASRRNGCGLVGLSLALKGLGNEDLTTHPVRSQLTYFT